MKVKDLLEAKNHMGDREFQTYAGWKAACKKVNPSYWIEGDIDIAEAFVGPKPFKRGETYSIGEWGGDVGSIFTDPAKTDQEPVKEARETKKLYTVSQHHDKSWCVNAPNGDLYMKGMAEQSACEMADKCNKQGPGNRVPAVRQRDPNHAVMVAKRTSGAMGLHKDKKRDLELGNVKHKKPAE